MTVYLALVVILNFLVDFLLLVGTAKMCGCRVSIVRSVVAALIGAIYSGCCLLPGAHFLGNMLLRILSLCLICALAFRFDRKLLQNSGIFITLSLALGGVTTGGDHSTEKLLWLGGVLCVMCLICGHGRRCQQEYIQVSLYYGRKCVKLTALKDTGNMLRDPVTGGPVMIVSSEIAEQLLGVKREQLQNPVETLSSYPGLRLVPYRTVGQDTGLLLALKLQEVVIGSWKGSMLVAFAPVVLSEQGTFQALTGGIV